MGYRPWGHEEVDMAEQLTLSQKAKKQYQKSFIKYNHNFYLTLFCLPYKR